MSSVIHKLPNLSVQEQKVAPAEMYLPWIPQAIYASCYPPVINLTEGTSSAIAYENFVFNLMERKEASSSFFVTSSIEDTSSSWILMNLVYYLCKANQRVLLIDADFQFPTVHHALDIPYDEDKNIVKLLKRIRLEPEILDSELLLSIVLDYCHSVSQIASLTVLPNYTLASQFYPDETEERLLRNLVASLEPAFDWIIVDTPPLLASNIEQKSVFLSRNLLLLEDRQANYEQIHEIRNHIRLNNLSLLGVIRRRSVF